LLFSLSKYIMYLGKSHAAALNDAHHAQVVVVGPQLQLVLELLERLVQVVLHETHLFGGRGYNIREA